MRLSNSFKVVELQLAVPPCLYCTEDSIGDAAGTLAKPCRHSCGSTHIDLDHLGSFHHRDTIMCQSSQDAFKGSVQSNGVDVSDEVPGMDRIADVVGGPEDSRNG